MKKGFTIIELLVTMFIAVAFLMAGYQLYGMIIKDGSETQLRTKAANIANSLLQTLKADNKYYCKTNSAYVPPSSPVFPNDPELPNYYYTYDIACPYNTTNLKYSLTKITITVSYGNQYDKSVSDTAYVYGE